MPTIRVGFSKPKKWKPFAFLIMFLYGIPYDHVYIRIASTKYSRDLIYQASKMMVNFMGTDLFSAENDIIDEFPVEISDENYIKMMQFAIDNAGKPYGILEAIGLGIVRIAEVLGRQIKNPFNPHGASYVCSVLAGYILEDYALEEIPGDVADVSPKVLFDFLSKLKK